MNVLIDDDKLIHLGWIMKAQKAGVELNCFFSVDEFIAVSDKYDLTTNVYVDSDLKQGQKGEIEAKRLFDLGFQNLYLVTGYSDVKVEDYQWLKGVLDKKAPF